MKYKMRILIVVLMVVFFFSCNKENDTKGIDFSLKISPKIESYDNVNILTLTDKLFIKMNFEYKLNDKFDKLDKNTKVFVHFWRKKQDKMLLNFDHTFKSVGVKDASTWKKGDVIKYSKVVFIPKFLDDYDAEFDGFEEINLTIGLHNPKIADKKIVLYHKTVRIEAEESHAPAINYQDGWYNIETNPKADKKYQKWQWIKKKATCIIDNKNYESKVKKNFTFIIRGRVPKGILKDQSVIFKINDKEFDNFIPKTEFFEKTYTIKPEQMGNDYAFNLSIESDMDFIPSKLDPNSKDSRELSMQIFYIYFREAIQ